MTEPTTEKPRELAPRQIRFSLRFMLCATFVAAVISWLVLELAKQQELNLVETQIVGGLQQISSGILNYSETINGGFLPPPNIVDGIGNSLYSWRLKVLMMITSPPVSPDWKATWDAPTNRSLANWACWVFCSSARAKKQPTETSLFAVAGKGTAFDISKQVAIEDIDEDVILVMEIANSGVHWMEPGDYEVTELLSCNGRLRDCVSGNFSGRVHVLFADGEVWCLDDGVPMERIKRFLLLEEAAKYSREEELGEYRINKW